MAETNTPEAWYKALPVMTRYGLTTIVATTILVQLEVLDPMLIILDWQRVMGKVEVRES
jgi:hypothetical protein